jgi:XRE family transcriptional regulator, aerobic/anaerobic benzoate catabolism transcriptional regulator
MVCNILHLMLLQELGERLRARRQERGLTQAELAERTGLSPRFLVQLEKGDGNISISRLSEVCEALALPLDALFRGLGPGAPEKVALVGLRGAGKTTVGMALAERLAVSFVEVDAKVEEEAGMTLAEIFQLRGEAHYRNLETQVLEALLSEPGPAVLATGGSIVTSPEAWKLLRAQARTIWLKASPASHLRRVQDQGDLRPMRGRPNALGEIREILAEREGLYSQADQTFDTDRMTPQDIAERI